MKSSLSDSLKAARSCYSECSCNSSSPRIASGTESAERNQQLADVSQGGKSERLLCGKVTTGERKERASFAKRRPEPSSPAFLPRKAAPDSSKQPSRLTNKPPGNTKQPPGSAKRRPLFTKRLTGSSKRPTLPAKEFTGSAKRRSFSRSGFPFDEAAYLLPRTNLPKQQTISHLRIK